MRFESFLNQVIKDPIEQAKVFHGEDKKTLALLTAIHRDIVEPMSKSYLRMAEGIEIIANHGGKDEMSSMYKTATAQEIQKETASVVEKLRGEE